MAIVEVPWQHLSPEALNNLIEEFVTRDGTDYGAHEILIRDKAEDLLTKIKNKSVLIFFDEASESCQLIYKEDRHLYV